MRLPKYVQIPLVLHCLNMRVAILLHVWSLAVCSSMQKWSQQNRGWSTTESAICWLCPPFQHWLNMDNMAVLSRCWRSLETLLSLQAGCGCGEWSRQIVNCFQNLPIFHCSGRMLYCTVEVFNLFHGKLTSVGISKVESDSDLTTRFWMPWRASLHWNYLQVMLGWWWGLDQLGTIEGPQMRGL